MSFKPKSIYDRLKNDDVSFEENQFIVDKLLGYLTRRELVVLEKYYDRSANKSETQAFKLVIKKIKGQYKKYIINGRLPRKRVGLLIDIFPPIEELEIEENMRIIDDLLSIIGFNREKSIRDYLNERKFSLEEELMIKADIKRLRTMYSAIPDDLEKIKLLYGALDLIEIQFRNNGYNKAGYDMYKASVLNNLGLNSNSFLGILVSFKDIAYEEIKGKSRE